MTTINLRKFASAECGTVENNAGFYLLRGDVYRMLDDIADYDDAKAMLAKIEAYKEQVA